MTMYDTYRIYRYILINLMKTKSFSIKLLAKQIKMPTTTLWRQLKGVSPMPIKTIIAIEQTRLFVSQAAINVLEDHQTLTYVNVTISTVVSFTGLTIIRSTSWQECFLLPARMFELVAQN